MAGKKTELVHFGEALADILGDYTEQVDNAIASGADEAAQIFIRHAQTVSPPDRTGEYRKSWTTNDSKGRYRRYVGNSKMVPGKNGSKIPLINILEYSTVRGNKHVKQAAEESKSEIMNCYVKKLNEGANNA